MQLHTDEYRNVFVKPDGTSKTATRDSGIYSTPLMLTPAGSTS